MLSTPTPSQLVVSQEGQFSYATKTCSYCGETRPLEDFHHYGHHLQRVGRWCRCCYWSLQGCRLAQRRCYSALRRAAIRRATPPWANRDEIAKIYQLAAMLSRITGQPHHVEHVVPLIHPAVSGLHCASNLRIVPAIENLKKGNRFSSVEDALAPQNLWSWLRQTQVTRYVI